MNYRTACRIILGAALALLILTVRVPAAESGESGTSSLTLLFYIINFVAFVVLLSKYAGARIKGYFSDRARTISSTFADLEGALREAKAHAARATELLERLGAEKAQIEARIRSQTEHEVGAIHQSARNLAAQIRRDSEFAARSISEAAERQFRLAVARRAAQAARKLLRDNLEPTDQQRLVEDFVVQMSGPEAQ
jgi:F0F1-type ATP synthase membrane subunit b/b'